MSHLPSEVEDDLIVLPQPLKQAVGLPARWADGGFGRRNVLNDVGDGAPSVDGFDHLHLGRVDEQDQVGSLWLRLINAAAAPAGSRSRTLIVSGRRSGT